MKKGIFWILTFYIGIFANDSTGISKTLRISTWPADAEIYVGERPKSFIEESEMKSPDSLKLSMEDSVVRITLFKPGYTDTTIDIHLKAPTKNFVWIELVEETDLDRLEWQEAILGKREGKKIGKIFFGTGFIPLALSGIFAGIAEYKFQNAEDTKEKIEKSLIREGDHYQKLQDDFKDSRQSGKNFRRASFISLGASALLFAAAAVFYF
ncbi:MAG: hypothetical protein J6Z31_05550 [Fibrobacter sp.]|nr:hypothetical protein [Fibrobacter sp.]